MILNSKEKILLQAKGMFAENGFSDVSMRSLANAVNMSVASLYHHFPDKNALYLETVQFAFSDKAMQFEQVWQQNCSDEEKLGLFISSLLQMLISDREFHRLIQREIIDANQERMKMLAEDVFEEQFCLLLTLMKQIAPKKDQHLAAVSILGLCLYQLEMQPLLRFLKGYKPEHERLEVISKHVIGLLFNGLKESEI